MRDVAARNSRMHACRSFCLAMQASLASGVMSTLITNQLRCAVLEHRELKEKSIAPCRRRDGDGKREKADTGQVAEVRERGWRGLEGWRQHSGTCAEKFMAGVVFHRRGKRDGWGVRAGGTK